MLHEQTRAWSFSAFSFCLGAPVRTESWDQQQRVWGSSSIAPGRGKAQKESSSWLKTRYPAPRLGAARAQELNQGSRNFSWLKWCKGSFTSQSSFVPFDPAQHTVNRQTAGSGWKNLPQSPHSWKHKTPPCPCPALPGVRVSIPAA